MSSFIRNKTGNRREILEKLTVEMAKISRRDDYNHNLTKDNITFDYSRPSRAELHDFPMLHIAPGPSNYSRVTNCKYESGRSESLNDGWLVSITGYVGFEENVDEINVATLEAESLIADIMKRVIKMGDMGLSHISSIAIESIDPFISFQKKFAFGIVVIRIKHSFSFRDI